jgi:hypothetical protein
MVLHVKVVYLPTRCPEHLLSNQVQSFQYQIMGAINHEVVALIGPVFDDIKNKTIVKTCIHCGYFHSHLIGLD